MTIKETLIANIIDHWDFRKGTLKDQSGNSNDLTATGTPYWQNTSSGRALKFNGSTDFLTTASSGVTDTASLTLYAKIKVGPTLILAKIIYQNTSIQAPSTTNGFQLSLINDGRFAGGFVKDSGHFDKKSTTVLKANETYHLVTTFNGSDVKLYLNGVLETNLGLTLFVAGDTLDLNIAQQNDGNQRFNGVVLEAMIFDTVLSDLQISQFYKESVQEAYISTLPKRNFQLPELLSFPNFERDLEWTKGTGWTISTGKASSDGSQGADSDLTQSIATIGRKYTIQYELRNYSAGNITALSGTAEGTDRAANGVYTEFLTQAGNTNIGLRADLNFVGDIAWMKVGEDPKTVYRNTFKDAVVTIASSGDQLNGFKVDSGAWKITDDGTDKWLENVTAGVAYIGSLQAFGTYQFDIYKGADANNLVALFIADVIGNNTATGQDGYNFTFDSTEALLLRESTNGTSSTKFSTAASYAAIQTKYSIRITRTFAGIFTAYVKGGAFTSWTVIDASGGSGTNPVTDTTTATSKYLVFDFDAGDKISGIKMFDGILSPTDFPDL